jgi:leader peptidase (prepilin peptidase)/N-methyltransferase
MILWDVPQSFAYVYLFLLGAVIGSFLNVCAHRFPQHEAVSAAWKSLLSPPSSCPYCRRKIWAIDNVPVLGWLKLRGRCRFCRHRISFRYPLIELLNGLLFIGVYWVMVPAGFTATIQQSGIYSEIGPWGNVAGMSFRSQSLWLHLQYAYFMVLIEALLVASLIDIDLQIIPDSVTLPAMAVGVLGSLTGRFWLVPVWFQNSSLMGLLWNYVGTPPAPKWWTMPQPEWIAAHPLLHGLAVSLVGLTVGGGIVWFVRIAGAWVFRREAMGFGDVILMALIGSYLGWQATVLVFFLAPVCALVIVGALLVYDVVAYLRGTSPELFHRREIPFGPYLSLAALWVLLGWRGMSPASSPLFNLGPLVPMIGLVLAATLVAVLWLVQGVKWLLGWQLYEDEWIAVWTSADQLSFFANKDPRDGVGPMKRAVWPGADAGQGTLHQRNWRGG